MRVNARAVPLLTAIALALAACTAQPPSRDAASASTSSMNASVAVPLKLTLLAFNDFHGQLSTPADGTPIPSTDASGKPDRLPTGGAAWLAGTLSQLRAQNPLTTVVAAGDLISASPLNSSVFHDEPSIEAMNLAGLEFSSVGNHEFDHGLAELQRMQGGGCSSDAPKASCHRGAFTGARFKYLAANVTDASTGHPVFPASALKTFDLGNGRPLKVGFIGAVIRSVPELVIPAMVKTLAFGDEAEAINAAVPALRAQGAEVIVVLIHEGGITSASAFDDTACPNFSGAILPIVDRLDPAIDAVVSGHTHRTYICRHNGRLVTSAGAQGRFVTDIELTLDPASHRVVASTAKQVAVTSGLASSVKDPEVEALVDAYTKDAAPLTGRVVANIKEDITRRPSASGENAIGDLVADAHLAVMSAPADGGAQVAFMNATGIRMDLLAATGRVTYGDIHGVHPFGNALVAMTLTGAQIHALLERQWTGGRSQLQVSASFTYEWRATRAPGARVEPSSIRLNGKPIDPTGKYRIVTNEFLAGGGDGFTEFVAGTDRVRGMLDSEALEKYATAHSPLVAPAMGRIRKAP
jgi:5'-nucleotidase